MSLEKPRNLSLKEIGISIAAIATWLMIGFVLGYDWGEWADSVIGRLAGIFIFSAAFVIGKDIRDKELRNRDTARMAYEAGRYWATHEAEDAVLREFQKGLIIRRLDEENAEMN